MRRIFTALVWPVAVLGLALACAPAQAQAPETQGATIELNAAHGAGTPGTTDKVVVENLRVVGRHAVSYGGGVFGWATTESVYNVTYRFDPATLRLVQRRELREHYARTLRLWRERFDDASPLIRAHGFDETFSRIWQFYLAYSEAGFRSGYLGVSQLQLVRASA